MPIREVLRLGNPQLYEISAPVQETELDTLEPLITDLHDTMMAFRQQWQAGRAIAAPQIGVQKRIIYMQVDRPIVLINPYFDNKSEAMQEVWDDCMCFPELLVKVRRHQSCRICYRDRHWRPQSLDLDGSLSELLQHEVDHLDGILAVSLAIDAQAFALRSQQTFTTYHSSYANS
ncbi:MAG: peptide deformylase [Oculatellaceae cyanobacterium Prado106]|jgi:peptide deformylase|nr:peptide deformylase [Oculatellaceae cyanobacterium Prado106]